MWSYQHRDSHHKDKTILRPCYLNNKNTWRERLFIETGPWYLAGQHGKCFYLKPLQWCHNARDGVSNHRRLDCLLNRFYRRTSNKTSKLRVTGLCEGNSQMAGEFSPQTASNAENVSINLMMSLWFSKIWAAMRICRSLITTRSTYFTLCIRSYDFRGTHKSYPQSTTWWDIFLCRNTFIGTLFESSQSNLIDCSRIKHHNAFAWIDRDFQSMLIL